MNQQSTAWNPGYQKRDIEIVDYQEYRIDGIDEALRGPEPDLSGGAYFSCIGAAQTFGVFVEQPFPALLARETGLAALNFGLPAAGPGFYAAYDRMIDLINAGRFCIVQVMAARAEANSLYAAEGYCETVRDRATGEVVSSFTSWSRIVAEDPAALPRLVAETQENWVASYRRLFDRITVPTLLVWISHDRKTTDVLDLSQPDINELYFKFPQFVDAGALQRIIPMADAFVACESTRNYGHPLVSRFTGEPTAADNELIHPSGKGQILTTNHYYPSPEMHEDIAADIAGVLRGAGWPGHGA